MLHLFHHLSNSSFTEKHYRFTTSATALFIIVLVFRVSNYSDSQKYTAANLMSISYHLSTTLHYYINLPRSMANAFTEVFYQTYFVLEFHLKNKNMQKYWRALLSNNLSRKEFAFTFAISIKNQKPC